MEGHQATAERESLGLTWPTVDEVSSSAQGLCPEGSRHAGVVEQASDTIIQHGKDALGLAVSGKKCKGRKGEERRDGQ